MANVVDRRKCVVQLFRSWESQWGLRGDPVLWEELKGLLSKEPLPVSSTQLQALLEKAFEQLVGISVHSPRPTFYVERFDGGGLSGGHISLEFWKNVAFPEIHKRYSILRYENSMKGPRIIDKPCRYEYFPEGCRYGSSCRFRHSKPIIPLVGERGDVFRSSGLPPSHLSIPSNFSTSNMSSGSLQSSNLSLGMNSSESHSSDEILDRFGKLMVQDRYEEMPNFEIAPFRLPNQDVCLHNLRGKCTYGMTCRFAHM